MRRAVMVLVSVAFTLAIAVAATARPGGGHSFSSGSYSRSPGSSYSYHSPSYHSSSSSGSWHSSSNSGSSFWGSSPSPSPSPSPRYDPTPSYPGYPSYPSYPGTPSTHDYRHTPSHAAPYYEPTKDPPLWTYFWIPGLIFGLVSSGAFVQFLIRKRNQKHWATMADDLMVEGFEEKQRLAVERYPSIRAALQALQSKDNAFSYVLLEDFLYALYTEAHTARGERRLATLTPYFAEEARNVLRNLPDVPVTAIVIGGMSTLEVTTQGEDRRVHLKIGFDANYTEGEQSYAAYEIWSLSRDADAESRPPKRARVLGCASCGAPLEKLVSDRCEYCGTLSTPGAGDWHVDAIKQVSRETRPPQLTGTTVEEGTNLPTLVQPGVKGEFGALTVRDPTFTWASFTARVEHIFHTFQKAWSAQNLAPVRPYLSDMLFEAQQHWVHAYQAQHLRNITENARVLSIALSRVIHDKYFDAITVRVFAESLDYTLDASDFVVGGSRTSTRQYTEYWTLIRSAEKRGAAGTAAGCPNCGAPLDQINMAGECAACQAHVTTGEFDWVLSRIEQDETYQL